jgi:DNA helicase II / ATP-dependent DNA helicase PcrA
VSIFLPKKTMRNSPISIDAVFAGLSEEQKSVVSHRAGHALVSAVAGSGKTLTLIRRILFLLNSGVRTEKILVVMFNRGAQESFIRRLEAECTLFGLTPPKVFTFHGLGLRICKLMVEANYIPKAELRTEDFYPRRFLSQALEKATTDHEIEESTFSGASQITELFSLIDAWKGDLFRPIEVKGSPDYKEISPVLKDAYLYYEELREEHRFRTFADLLYDPVMAIRLKPDLQKWAAGRHTDRYHHILVDEYQDVNLAQQELIQTLAGSNAKVMVVGDEDQCIYEWRGSRPDYMTGLFEQLFGGAKKYTLSHTYRFGHPLSLAANSLICQNKKRTKKLCISSPSTSATSVNLYQVSESDDGGLVAGLVGQWLDSGRKLSEAAVLVRSWAMALAPELELVAAGIPYVMGDGSKSYRSRPEIQALIGFLSLGMQSVMEPGEGGLGLVFQSMLRYSGLFLKKEQTGILCKVLAEEKTLYWEVLRDFANRTGLHPKVKNRIEEVACQWELLCGALRPEQPASQALEFIERALAFKEQVGKNHISSQYANDSLRAMDALFSHAKAKKMDLTSFFEHLTSPAPEKGNSSEAVLITSVHKAKGCEWPLVILPQLEDGRFPHFEGESPNEEEMEQERRLFYVAITRAIEHLALIAPSDENLTKWLEKGFFGRPKFKEMIASRFLYESGLFKSNMIGEQICSGVRPSEIEVGEKDYLYQSYLKRLSGQPRLR